MIQTFKMIATDQLQPSGHNPPSRTSSAALRELLSMIRTDGQVLSPLQVAPLPTNGYRIMVGHRRYACAVELELPFVPCIVVSDTGMTQGEYWAKEATGSRKVSALEWLYVHKKSNGKVPLPGRIANEMKKASHVFGEDATEYLISNNISPNVATMAIKVLAALNNAGVFDITLRAVGKWLVEIKQVYVCLILAKEGWTKAVMKKVASCIKKRAPFMGEGST